MRSSFYAASALGALLLATGAQAQNSPAAQANTASRAATATAAQSRSASGALSATDQEFLRQTAQGADYELAMAKLAEQKATRQDIKQYAQTLVSDHDRLNTALHDLAQKMGVQLPSQMSQQQQDKMSHLQGLSGNAFDQAYLADTRSVNSQDKTELQKETSSAQNLDVRAFAQQMQAADAKHQQMAQTLQGHG